jgi:hypothetical protein
MLAVEPTKFKSQTIRYEPNLIKITNNLYEASHSRAREKFKDPAVSLRYSNWYNKQNCDFFHDMHLHIPETSVAYFTVLHDEC